MQRVNELFSHGYHDQWHCSWACTNDNDDDVDDDDDDGDGVAQHGGHTPNIRLTETLQPWFTVYFFDIGHPCYDQLTPVKTKYHLLTSIT